VPQTESCSKSLNSLRLPRLRRIGGVVVDMADDGGSDGEAGADEEANSDEQLDDVRRSNIGDKTKPVYLNANVRFLRRAVEKERSYLAPRFKDTYLSNLQPPRSSAGKAQNTAIKAAIVAADEACPPILIERFAAGDLGKYLNYVADNDGKQRGLSALKVARSSTLWMLKQFRLPISAKFKDELAILWKGFSRVNAKAIAQGKGELKVGKDHITQEDYISLCNAFFSKGWTFALVCTVLAWNLIARVGNVMLILLAHIGVRGDHLEVHFAQMKTDQEGNNARYPRSVFANPLRPQICPVLALAVHLLLTPSSDVHLFGGGHQYDCYIKVSVLSRLWPNK